MGEVLDTVLAFFGWLGARETLFWAFSGIAVACAGMCITRRSPVASALYLVVTMFSLAVLFALLDAQFIAVLQILVYAGAIMVLFLFVIMLLNLGRPGPSDLKGPWGLGLGAALSGLLLLQLGALGAAGPPEAIQLPEGAVAALQAQQGVVGAVARPLFSEYLIPFEITSVLLLAAMVGAVVLAKRRL
ncbi:MAG TPA: NADH-quinone oxidoreductase subunit J [Gemmatimonadales bacterium]